MNKDIRGKLFIIGGAEDKSGKKEILNIVSECINKEKDILLVATIATKYPQETFDKYKDAFEKLSVKNIEMLNISKRSHAFSRRNVELVKSARLIFFTGGDQLRITSIIGGTPVYDALFKAYMSGTNIAGTSAGASVMSDTMIVDGDDDNSPRKCTLKMAPGLGFLKKIIIDQHFAQRGRIGRLLTGIAENPSILGIGIDENTAIIINQDDVIEVIGEGAVYIIDGTQIKHTNVSELKRDEILSMTNVILHVLTSKHRYCLKEKKPLEEEKDRNEDFKNQSF